MEYVVYVDSNNRNQTMYPNSNSYTLHLATPIRNIARAELVSAMLPSLNVSQFVCLDILELRSPQHQTADALVRSTTANVLTVTWRQPNNGAPYYDSASSLDLGRNMFLLRFETVVEDLKPERPMGLPDPVEWESGEKNRLWIIAFVAVAGLIIIMSMRGRKAAQRASLEASLKSV